MATQTSGRTVRRTRQPQARLPLTELVRNPKAYEDTVVGDAVDKLAQRLDSVDLQDQQPPAPDIPSQSKPKPKTTKGPGNTKTKRPTTQKQDQSPAEDPPIVRRSRRGEKAVSAHPLVGQYRVELTSSERRWCGKFALGISTEAQLGVRMAVEEFDDIFGGVEGAVFNARNRWDNDSDFYDEQLDFVLRVWGLRRGLGRLQLGVVRDFEGAFVNNCVPPEIPWGREGDINEAEGENVKREECRTVWIHNDNAMLLGRPCNHYSGVVVLQKGS